jgi:hypothetical protein
MNQPGGLTQTGKGLGCCVGPSVGVAIAVGSSSNTAVIVGVSSGVTTAVLSRVGVEAGTSSVPGAVTEGWAVKVGRKGASVGRWAIS